ncbi:mannosyl-glycoprotein endo-beta-N-acetylglucosamidase [Enterococcus villorum]|uniref:Mannosyl-glycoprotein endo-beta-N-acetylglucosamidase n=1 Tax=Enterococcus villorum TaxID=112904 RepID=A0A1V8Y881_9ENTE|nr:discoidin domain-containing protein [Enterococcus villorum]OQO68526.1 mannosyl-glycoprotein endo-beta-N-acetylglucosamidase [Enterococcus villorum]OQO74402.1 mannosyl-glycoprotein endo-beta-N-acetylglucosamidase [Enterococcus villorum]
MKELKRNLKTGMLIAVSLTSVVLNAEFVDAQEDSKQTETSIISMNNQPESSYWFPNELLAWSFDQDADAKYNVSVEPLAKRVEKSQLLKSNRTQNEKMKVVALSIMNSSTSGNAPRGTNQFDANVFSNWQYIDQLVYWGGSSGEGLIVPPSPDVTDAAHKNGVPVLGTIFFPQGAHGGKIEWLNTFLEKDATGHFPIVDKMIEVAEKYGFDGWFINQETETGLNKKHADLMKELIVEFKQKSAGKLEVMWYDSMTNDGKMDWQNALTDHNQDYLVDANLNPVADSMFLNFWWNTDSLASQDLLRQSKEKAESLGIDPYNLFAGIDVQEKGYDTPVKWNLFANNQGIPYTSLGLYVPSWTYSSANNPDEYQQKEEKFWVNEQGDPTKSVLPVGTNWPGISAFSVEQTAITQWPFVTNFNVGNGYGYSINGKQVSTKEWNNRSLQDILPTYRFIIEEGTGNDLTGSVDYTTAFNGGSSLAFKGKMAEKVSSKIKLYQTKVKIEKNMTFTTTAKATDRTSLKLVLGFEDGTKQKFNGNKKITDDWTTVSYHLNKVVGKIVTSISYEVSSVKNNGNYAIHFGQIAATPKETLPTTTVSDVSFEDIAFDEEGMNAGIRLAWSGNEKENIQRYEIYRVKTDGTRQFIGATPAENYFINGLERQKETSSSIEIVPINRFGKKGTASQPISFEWPAVQLPRASFTVSKTLAAPGESITFTDTSSKNTENLKWVFKGADVESSTAQQPTVTYSKEGVYDVELTASNEAGETTTVIKGIVTITTKAQEGLSLLSRGAKVEASSYVNESEAPRFAVDGDLGTKWCAVGSAPHTITVDLGTAKTISEVQMAHAFAGGESASMNTKAYTIEVSQDGKNFHEVSRTTNNTQGMTLNTFAVTTARFVRVIVDQPTQGADSAVRLYELEVYGLNE